MRHLRKDYDAIQPWPVKRPHIGFDHEGKLQQLLPGEGVLTPLIPDDEPVFLLRGQDPAAAPAVRSYIRYAAAEGADPAFLAALDGWAEEMADWAERVQHGAPDVPAGMIPEAADRRTRRAIEYDGPRLGLATTQQLLDEIRARIEADGANGGGGLGYRTVDGLGGANR